MIENKTFVNKENTDKTTQTLSGFMGMTSIYETNEVVHYFTVSVSASLCDKCTAFPVAASRINATLRFAKRRLLLWSNVQLALAVITAVEEWIVTTEADISQMICRQ